MSFSMDVKEELSRQLSNARHCLLAELAAILSFEGQLISSKSGYYIRIQTENLVTARKYFTLIRKTFNINIDVSVKTNIASRKKRTYVLIVRRQNDVDRILQATKLSGSISPDQAKAEKGGNINIMRLGLSEPEITQNSCCKRSFIRGAFLSSGSMSNPKKAYHLEFDVPDLDKAQQLKELILAFHIDAKIVRRKNSYVVYIKEGSQIVDLLNVMEAHVALMNLENVRILKEMRNQVNRQVNCEAANISKTVAAASKQMEDILYIKEHMGFGDLADGLKEIAQLRIDYPEASLKELGSMLSPPIGKSGVNHRLRKLSMIADQLREHKEEDINDN